MQTQEFMADVETSIANALPKTENNLRRLRNARPDNWQNPQPAPMYNLIVIGGGSAYWRRLWRLGWAARWR